MCNVYKVYTSISGSTKIVRLFSLVNLVKIHFWSQVVWGNSSPNINLLKLLPKILSLGIPLVTKVASDFGQKRIEPE